MRYLILVLTLMLSACGGGGSDSGSTANADATGNVEVTCAAVSNDAGTVCGQRTASFSLISTAKAALISEGGAIDRTQPLVASMTILNSRPVEFKGYRVVMIAPSCSGSGDPWMAYNGVTNLAVAQSVSHMQTYQCSAQPLGPATTTVIVYEGGYTVCATGADGNPAVNPDGTCDGTVWTGGTEVDRAVVTYTVTP